MSRSLSAVQVSVFFHHPPLLLVQAEFVLSASEACFDDMPQNAVTTAHVDFGQRVYGFRVLHSPLPGNPSSRPTPQTNSTP